MFHSTVIRAAGALVLTLGLAGCIDVTMEIEVIDEANGRGTTTMVMDREFYDMSIQQSDEPFCDEDSELTVTETDATCVSVKEGSYADLIDSDDPNEPVPTVVPLGDGTVRVTFPTASLADDMAEDEMDAETLAMMQGFFAGKFMTLKASGGEVVDTNMTVADDGMSASLQIPFLDLMTGEADVPDEAYAIIRLN